MNVIELLDQAARRTPDATAIIDGPYGKERVISFADLDAWSRRIATLFARAGVGAGDGVVILIPMSAPLYAVIAATLRLGAVTVFIDPKSAAAQLDRCRTALPLRAFVGTPMACLYRCLSSDLRAIRPAFVSHGWFPGATSLRAARDVPPVEHTVTGLDLAPAMLTFTSGSTGVAKGLLRSHRLMLATQTILAHQLDLKPGSVDLATMPALVMANLGHGVTSLIPDVDLRRPAAADPDRIARSIERWQANSLLASPALVEHLADHCLATGKVLSSLRAVYTGGAPVFPLVLQKTAQVAPQARVFALYGSTEAEPIALLCHDQITPADRIAIAHGAGLPAGKPISEIKLQILEDRCGDGQTVGSAQEINNLASPAGARGEIVVSGPHVAPGYLGGLGDAETKFQAGDAIWHRTGDSGWLDEQGRLWLTGRCAARVGEPPEAIYPLMVEAALADHPNLVRAAFIVHRGQRLLVLEIRQGATPPELKELVNKLPWAGIERLVTLPHIPLDRRHNAKIDYPALLYEINHPYRKWLFSRFLVLQNRLRNGIGQRLKA